MKMTRSRIGITFNNSLGVQSLVLRDGKHILNIPYGRYSITNHGLYKGYYEYVGYMVELVYNLQKGTQPYRDSGHWTFRPREENDYK